MKSNLNTALAAAGCALALSIGSLVSTAASATTITFSGLAGANGTPVATYTEGGFNLTTIVGQFFQGQLFGNPVPSIFAGPLFGGPTTDAIAVAQTAGVPFTFSALDLATANANTAYTFTGLLHGAPVFSVNDTVSSPAGVFNTVLSGVSADVIDTLVIAANIGAGGTSTNIDNIVVNAVPGPIAGAGLPGFLAACCGLLALARRRRRRRTV
jgi:hypothetical protein